MASKIKNETKLRSACLRYHKMTMCLALFSGAQLYAVHVKTKILAFQQNTHRDENLSLMPLAVFITTPSFFSALKLVSSSNLNLQEKRRMKLPRNGTVLPFPCHVVLCQCSGGGFPFSGTRTLQRLQHSHFGGVKTLGTSDEKSKKWRCRQPNNHNQR